MTTTAPTIETVRALAAKYNNWGKWGPDDQKGTLNFVTPEMIKASAQLVRKGKVFSLALPLDCNGPQTGSFGRYNPLHHMIVDGGDIDAGEQDHLDEVRYTDDAAYIILQSSTQWDSLAHIFHDGKMYNGYGTNQVTSKGAKKNSITNAKDAMVGRGVLLDVPRHQGKPWLDVDHAIQADELAACAAAQGVEVGEGDFVLVRTGQMAMCRDAGGWGDYAGGAAPGFGVSAPTSSARATWPPRSPTPGAPRSCPTRRPTSSSRCTSSCWSTTASTSARCGTWRSSPPTARRTASTSSSSSPRR